MSFFLRGFVPVLLCSLGALARAQGIPVMDVTNIAQSIEAVSQLQAQLAQQIAILKSMTGTRGMGGLNDDPQLHATLPSDWIAGYEQLGATDPGNLPTGTTQIRAANQLVACANDAGIASSMCRRAALQDAQTEAYASSAYQHTESRLQQIESLMAQIDATPDAKASADLTSRLIGELASIQNETNRLNLFALVAGSEQRLLSQQRHEYDLLKASQSTSTARGLAPLTFQ